MNPFSNPSLRSHCLIMAVTYAFAGALPVPGRAEEPVVRLAPVTVRAADATIEVRFTLSGTRLFDPCDDPILEAKVVRVIATDAVTESALLPHDVLLGINGRDLTGRTLREIAAIVAAARREPRQLWQVRRGFGTVLIQHNGAWSPALPGLDR